MDSLSINKKKQYFIFLSLIRKYFANQGFMDAPAPPMVSHPGMEAISTHLK